MAAEHDFSEGDLDHLAQAISPQSNPMPVKKRRRLRACDSCRQRKIRCDVRPGSCGNCTLYGTACVITRDGTFLPRTPGEGKGPAAKLDQSPRRQQSSTSYANPSPSSSPQDHPPQLLNSAAGLYHDAPASDTLAALSPATKRSDKLEGVVTTEMGQFPKNSKFANMSSAQVLAKSAEELFKLQAPQIHVMNFFSPMMSFAEEYHSEAFSQLSPLITKDLADECYFLTYQPLFPILDVAEFHQTYLNFHTNPDLVDVPHKALVFLVIALGSFEYKSDVYHSHFQAVYSMYSHLMAYPYMSSVQCLILMTLCFMNVGKDGQAILTIGLAVRIAQSLGLHRSLSTHRHPHEFNFILKEHNLRNCIWWTCHCLDKKLCFESGRPSAICDEQCDADLPILDQPTGSTQSPFIFLQSFIGICNVLAWISTSLFNINSSSLDEAVLISRMSAADSELRKWSAALPKELQPEQDSLDGIGDPIVGIGARLLHCIYYNALMVIHRAGLVGGMSSDMRVHHNPRVAASDNTCLRAARLLARCVNDLFAESHVRAIPRWLNPYPFNAVVALFVGCMKSPEKWSCAIDIALMRTMQDRFQHIGTTERVVAHRFQLLVDSFCDAFDATKTASALVSRVTENSDHSNPRSFSFDSVSNHNLGRKDHVSTGIPNSGFLAAEENLTSPGLRTDLGSTTTNELQSADSNTSQVGGEQLQFGTMFGDHPSLWNLQLWPVDAWDSSMPHDQGAGH